MRRIEVPGALGIAVAMLTTLAIAHLAGGRDAVCVLSGTPPDGAIVLLAPLGVLYAMAWLASVLVAPPLFVVGLLSWWPSVRERVRQRGVKPTVRSSS